MEFGHDPKRIAEYMLWSAARDRNPVTPMQLLKLVYIAHGWTLGLLGRPLINEPVEAWQYGPVIPSVYETYKEFRGNFITRCPPQPPDEIDAAERRVLDQVWQHYGNLSGVALSSLTHQPGTPWDVTITQLGSGAIISNDLIEDHYRRLGEARA